MPINITNNLHSKNRKVGETVMVHWLTGDAMHKHSATGVVHHTNDDYISVQLTAPVDSPDPNQPRFEVGHIIAVPHTGDCWHPHPRVEPLSS